MNLKIHTEIDINAPASKVWHYLTDLAQYKNWNPFIVNAEGKIQIGETILVEPKVPGRGSYSFQPVITRYIEGREFSWTGDVMHRHVVSGEHIFILEPTGGNTVRLIHDEIFSGALAPLVVLFGGKKTKKGFIRMNEALKQAVE